MGLLLVVASAAYAQGQPLASGGYRPGNLLEAILSTLIFSAIGIGLAIVWFKLFDMVVPFELEREICEKNNIAAGILGAAMILGICLIVGLVVLS